MIARLLLIICLFYTSFPLFAQKAKKFSAEVNYGLNGNFFVSSSGYGAPGGPNTAKFYKKNFIGTVGGVELKYAISEHSSLGLAYVKSVNSKKVSYSGTFINVSISDWKIKHVNNFFQLFYERNFSKKNPAFNYQAGLFYLTMSQQEIDIGDFANGGISFEERNFKNSNLEEGGFFFGVQYSKRLDKKFELGIKSRVYYLISTSSLEAVTLTPVLLYHF
jgi:hypothetical protein